MSRCRRADEAESSPRLNKDWWSRPKILLTAFAKVGVTALIDEATGFQHARSPDALRILVQQYIEEEKRQWNSSFQTNSMTS